LAWAGIEQRFAAAPANLWRNLRLPGALYYLAAAAFVTSGGGILAGNKFVLPALDVLALLPIYFWLRLRRGFQGAVLALLFWSFCKAGAVAFFTVLLPARAAAAVAWGPAYANGMLAWVGSGADLAGLGAWGTWRPEETLAVAGTSLATAGLGGLAYATTLLNCQSYYLGALFLRAAEPWKVVVLGWPLWEGFRALAFANILLAAAEPTASRLVGRPTRSRDVRDGLIVGFLMLAMAYVAQIYLAPWWREVLAASLVFDVPPVLTP
jgi:hypothetical protein